MSKRDPWEDADGVIRVPKWYEENKRQRLEELMNRAADEILAEKTALPDPEDVDTDVFLLELLRGE